MIILEIIAGIIISASRLIFIGYLWDKFNE